jgi:uncharacterized membrane protein
MEKKPQNEQLPPTKAETLGPESKLADSTLSPSGTLTPEALSTIQCSLSSIELQQHWSSPLPPPHILEAYQKLVPTFAERMLAMAEKEGDHRRALEHKYVEAEIENKKEEIRQAHIEASFGQKTGGAIALFGFGCATICAYFGQSGVAIAIATTAIGSIVTAFLTNRFTKGKDIRDGEELQMSEATQEKSNPAPLTHPSSTKITED